MPLERSERSVLTVVSATTSVGAVCAHSPPASALFCQTLRLAQCEACLAAHMQESDLDSLAYTFLYVNEVFFGLFLGAKFLVCWHRQVPLLSFLLWILFWISNEQWWGTPCLTL